MRHISSKLDLKSTVKFQLVRLEEPCSNECELGRGVSDDGFGDRNYTLLRTHTINYIHLCLLSPTNLRKLFTQLYLEIKETCH